MARDIIDGMPRLPKHDLESFFWLLAWVSLRHVEDSLVDRFDMHKATTTRMLKSGWLYTILAGWKEIEVKANKPLIKLLGRLASLLLFGIDHDTMLLLFEDALNSKWPQDYRCTSPKSSRRSTHVHTLHRR